MFSLWFGFMWAALSGCSMQGFRAYIWFDFMCSLNHNRI